MAQQLKSTYVDLPRRPLGVLPQSAVPSPKALDIPQGRVRERISFYEKLKESRSQSPPRRQTTDFLFSRNRLYEAADLDNPQIHTERQTVAAMPGGKLNIREDLPQLAAIHLDTSYPPPQDSSTVNPPTENALLPPSQISSEAAEVTPSQKEEIVDSIETPAPVESDKGKHTEKDIVDEPPRQAEEEVNEEELKKETRKEVARKEEAVTSINIPPEINSSGAIAPHPSSSPETEKVATHLSLPGDSQEPATLDSDLDAVCVNCLEYVSLEAIDEHSKTCTHFESRDLSPGEEAMLKVRKLLLAIERRIQSASGVYLSILLRLREIAGDAARREDGDDALLDMELDDISASAFACEGGLGCAVYAKRLSVLAHDLHSSVVPEAQDTDQLLSHYTAEVERQRRELLKLQAQNCIFEAMAVLPGLTEVDSDVGSDAGSAASSRMSAWEESDVADMQAAEEALKEVSEAELKRFFYRACLKQKLVLPKMHAGQRVLASELYAEATRRSLPVAAWSSFISAQLQAA